MIKSLAVLFGVLFSLNVASQELLPANDTSRQASKLASVSRFSGGGSPVLNYSSDLGLKYGAIINLFDYGKIPSYPDYIQFAEIKLYKSTKGTSNLSILYDNEGLIKRGELSFEASYLEDIALDFYGFNGLASVIKPKYWDVTSPDYLNKYYNNLHRSLMTLRIGLQKYVYEDKVKLIFGVSHKRYKIGKLDFDRFEVPTGSGGAEEITLFERYTDWGIIPDDHSIGGNLSIFSFGVSFDTRLGKLNCKGGTWIDSYFLVSPKQLSHSAFIKQITTFRKYHHWHQAGVVLSYRISSQLKLKGEIPFYELSTFYDSKQDRDGYGGAYTLRGLYRNRLLANSYLLGNLEVRKSLFSFSFLKIHWELDASLFVDALKITREYEFNTKDIPLEYIDNFNFSTKQVIHSTFGAGAYLIYNNNNIISLNYGLSPNNQLGMHGIYVGSGFLF